MRLTVEPPGDPWHEKYGFPPGRAVFAVYGSVTHIHWGACLEEEGEHFLVAATALRTEEDPDLYDVHTTAFRVTEASLEVVMREQGAALPTPWRTRTGSAAPGCSSRTERVGPLERPDSAALGRLYDEPQYREES